MKLPLCKSYLCRRAIRPRRLLPSRQSPVPATLLFLLLIYCPTLAPAQCVGDCDGNGAVSIAEIVLGVNIASGISRVGVCSAMDADEDGRVGIDELLRAIGANLEGCRGPRIASGLCLVPGESGLVACQPGQRVRAFRCDDEERCLTDDGARTLIAEGVIADDGTFSVALGDVGERLAILEVVVDPAEGTRYRSLDFGSVARPGASSAVSSDSVSAVGAAGGAQIFDAALRVPIEENVRSFTLVDIDRDDAAELVVADADSFSGSVLVRPNLGDGRFGPPESFAVGSLPDRLVATDATRNGRPDLVVANALSDDVSVLVGRSNGSFSREKRTRSLLLGPTSEAAVQFLAGRPAEDLAVTIAIATLGAFNTASASASFAHAKFSTAVATSVERGTDAATAVAGGVLRSSTVNGASAWIELGDLNGDSIADGVVANEGVHAALVLAGRGDGSFAQAQAIALPAQPVKLVLGDLDEDGRLDLVAQMHSLASLPSASPVAVAMGAGDGTFSVATPVDVPPDFGEDLAVAEVTGDAHLDLIVRRSGYGLLVIPGLGDGTFGPARMIAASAEHTLFVGDLDGDRVAEVVEGDLDVMSIYNFSSNGTYSAAQRFAIGGRLVEAQVGDVDGDGRQDIAIRTRSDGCVDAAVSILRGSAGGHFRGVELVLDGFFRSSIEGETSATADVDNDGSPDLIWVAGPIGSDSSGSGEISIFPGSGDGRFLPTRSVLVTSEQSLEGGLAVGDLNGDGILDFAATASSSSGISGAVFVIDGQTLSVERLPDSCPLPRSPLVADVDGDGAADLVTVAPCPPKSCPSCPVTLSVRSGLGDGTFAAPVAVGLEEGVGEDLIAADVTGDGRVDLVATRPSGVLVLSDFGGGAFAKALDIDLGLGQQARIVEIEASDLDGDGRLDLVGVAIAPDLGGAVVFVSRANAQNAFELTTIRQLPCSGNAFDVEVGDVNGDRLPDVVVAGSFVSVFLNLGGATIGEVEQSFPIGRGKNDLSLADLNRDGVADLTIAGQYIGNVSVLLSAAVPVP
jgi:FG-GAP-like repeat